MAFTINKTDGTVLTTVQDGTLDETTNLSLFGKNYAGYGELLNENQIKLLENFANTTANAPDKPLTGQLFYDTTLKQIQVYDGTAFKAASGSIVSTTQPSTGAEGDLWYDSSNQQIYVYTGTSWILVGPIASSGSGTTGAVASTITDTGGTARSVLQSLLNDTVVAITSSVAFTPAEAVSGFSTISEGINLSTAIGGNKLHGTATDSDALGGAAASTFMKSNADDTTTGTITIQKDASLVLGADGDVNFTQSGANFTLQNTASDGNVIININDGGVQTTALTVTGSDASVTVANDLTVSGDIVVAGTLVGTVSQATVADTVKSIDANGVDLEHFVTFVNSSDSSSTANALRTDGGLSYNPSTNVLSTTASAAQYSDLAERYEADQPMQPGDVVKIGGDKEITKTTQQGDEQVFGVISTAPAYRMNADAGTHETHPYVALSGRVPCKVKGAVRKGDRLISSAEPGVAEAINTLEDTTIYAVIGRSLETNTDEMVKYVEIAVGRN